MIIQVVNFRNVGISDQQFSVLVFGDKMDFRLFHLLLQASHQGRSQYDIADGTKPDKQKFRFFHR